MVGKRVLLEVVSIRCFHGINFSDCCSAGACLVPSSGHHYEEAGSESRVEVLGRCLRLREVKNLLDTHGRWQRWVLAFRIPSPEGYES